MQSYEDFELTSYLTLPYLGFYLQKLTKHELYELTKLNNLKLSLRYYDSNKQDYIDCILTSAYLKIKRYMNVLEFPTIKVKNIHK